MNQAIMAHIVASITVFANVSLLIRREGTPLQTQGLPRCLVPLPREWRPTLCFAFRHHPQGFALYDQGIRSITGGTNPGYRVYNQICS